MPYPTCSTCKHWGDRAPGCPPYLGAFPCNKNSNLWFCGGGDENDSLYTQPTFGCIEHEPRDSSDDDALAKVAHQAIAELNGGDVSCR